MSDDLVKLVQGDLGSQLKFQILDDISNDPIDLTGLTVNLRIRKKGTTDVLVLIPSLPVSPNAENGIVIFPMETFLDSNPSTPTSALYEGEIEVETAGGPSSIYDLFGIVLRPQFGDPT